MRKSYSEISGSTVAYTSPEHFAVSRVLRRRLEPSLPPVRVGVGPDTHYFARRHKQVVVILGIILASSTSGLLPPAAFDHDLVIVICVHT